jgi:centrosomal protein CEP97
MSSSFHGIPTNISNHHALQQQQQHSDSNHLLDMSKSLIENFTSDSLMTQSLDPTILGSNTSMNSSMTSSMIIKDFHPSPTSNGNLYNEQSSIPIMHTSGPLITASKMMPVPETLMSPDCPPVTIQQQRPVSSLTSSASTSARAAKVQSQQQQQQRPSSSPSATKNSRIARKTEKSSPSNSPRKALMNTANAKIHQNPSILKSSQSHSNEQPPPSSTTISSVATTEDEDEDECDRVNVEKLKSIKKVAQKNQKQLENHHQLQKAVENKEVEKSAILIQKLWRGYSTRKQTVADMAEALQQKRTNDYIVKLTQDMEMTKQALENERKIQQLQMQAINALWKKVSNMQNVSESSGANENGAVAAAFSATGDSANIVHDLTKTCSMLTNQVSGYI